MHSAIHTSKQIGLDTEFAKATKALHDAELTKGECMQACNSNRNKGNGAKGGEPYATPCSLAIAKANHKPAMKAIEAVKLVITMTGAKEFKLYGNKDHQGPSDSSTLGSYL